MRAARERAGLTQTELARRAGTSQPNLNRIERGVSEPTLALLRRLIRACGSVLELRVTQCSPSKLDRVLARRRTEILDVARKRGVQNVRVYGSVARGDDTAASDLDLLISLEPGRDLVDLMAFREDVATILGVEIDVSTVELLRPAIRRRAVAEGVPL